MRIYLIRHGLTAGNLEKRYIGRTDEPICGEGRAQLAEGAFPACELLICSPMLRCLQTAELLFPRQKPIICDGLRECDFGDFEGKNYRELSDDPRYQAWIDSGGTMRFPGGESPDEFRERCCRGFAEMIREHGGAESAAFVVHGGTIMSVLDRYARPHRDYFDWQCGNGGGYCCVLDGEKLVSGSLLLTDTEKL